MSETMTGNQDPQTSETQPKPMQVLRERYCLCICCCAGQCRSKCQWCQREKNWCICGTSEEDRENPCDPCNPDCRHLNCNPEEARRAEREMQQAIATGGQSPE